MQTEVSETALRSSRGGDAGLSLSLVLTGVNPSPWEEKQHRGFPGTSILLTMFHYFILLQIPRN